MNSSLKGDTFAGSPPCSSGLKSRASSENVKIIQDFSKERSDNEKVKVIKITIIMNWVGVRGFSGRIR